ncbi:MAG: hypothetical protein Kow0068_09460 [Marinilabiliales bacterium]
MKNLLIILFILITNLYLSAQQYHFEWIKENNIPIETYYGEIIFDKDTNPVITGFYSDTMFIEGDTLLPGASNQTFMHASAFIKFNKNGDYIGYKRENYEALGLAIDSENSYYFSGAFTDTVNFENDTMTSNAVHNIYISKYDSLGVYQWSKQIKYDTVNFSPNGCVHVLSARINKNDEILILGQGNPIFNDTISYPNFNAIEVSFVAKYNKNGDYLSNVILPYYSENLYIDNESNIYFKGYVMFDSDTIIFYTDTLLKSNGSFYGMVSNDGSSYWIKQNTWITDISVIPNNNGGIHFIGRVNNDTLIIETDTLYENPTYYKYIIGQYSKNGDLLWYKTFYNKYPSNNKFLIESDKQGNLYLASTFEDSLNIGGIVIQDTINRSQIYITKFDSAGNTQWIKTFGGRSYDKIDILAIDDDCNIYLKGIFDGFSGYPDTCYLDSIQVIFEGDYNYLIKMSPESNNNYEEISPETNLFPNPTRGKVIVEAEGIEKIEVFNINGKQIYTVTEHEIDFSQKPAGIYIIRVTTDKEIITRKIIKQ